MVYEENVYVCLYEFEDDIIIYEIIDDLIDCDIWSPIAPPIVSHPTFEDYMLPFIKENAIHHPDVAAIFVGHLLLMCDHFNIKICDITIENTMKEGVLFKRLRAVFAAN